MINSDFGLVCKITSSKYSGTRREKIEKYSSTENENGENDAEIALLREKEKKKYEKELGEFKREFGSIFQIPNFLELKPMKAVRPLCGLAKDGRGNPYLLRG